jgi:hypothetical protein
LARDRETLRSHQNQNYWHQNQNKSDADGAMPKNVGPLRVRCKEVMGRVSPTAYPHPSDDEASVGEENDCVESDMRELSEAI